MLLQEMMNLGRKNNSLWTPRFWDVSWHTVQNQVEIQKDYLKFTTPPKRTWLHDYFPTKRIWNGLNSSKIMRIFVEFKGTQPKSLSLNHPISI